MTIAAGETIYEEFTTHNASTQALADADSLPTGTLVKNGVDTAVTVTITNKATGIYDAQFTIPGTYVAGDEVALRIAATIGGVATGKVVWQESLASGATTPAAAADYTTNLETIRDQASARLVEITAEQAPSYNVNGQQMSWNEYAKMLRETIAWANEAIAQGDGTPWEEEMQVFL
jgi:hypothetical protein